MSQSSLLLISLLSLASFAPPVSVPPRISLAGDCPPDGTVTNQTCARPITGCVCWLSSYTFTVTPGYNCMPCEYSFSGQFTCDGVNNTPHSSGSSIPCGEAKTFGWICPCNGTFFYPVQAQCGNCPPH